MAEQQPQEFGDGPAERPDRWLAPGEHAENPAGSGIPNAPQSGDPTSVPERYRPNFRPVRGGRGMRSPGRTRIGGRIGIVVLLVLAAITIAGVISNLNRSGEVDRPRPSATGFKELPTKINWKVEPAQLRSDLTEPRFISSVDGDFSGSYVAATADVWLTITGRENATDTMVHALNPQTGKEIWHRRLDGVLCDAEAPASGIVCASVLSRDPQTGLGTRWRLHRIDPADGSDRKTADINGWLTAVHRSGNQFIVLEQRQPAPHAVVRAFDVKDLTPRWSRDLLRQPGQAEMFSENRIIKRPEPERQGLALDRPRFRDVGHGLVAVWAGQRTAFFNAASGKLIMMPHCSRLVDDGQRLWCNEPAGAASYSYNGKLLHRILGPRLAFPYDNGIGVDRNRPIFLNDSGAPVSVDLKTGTVGGAYGGPGAGSAFGMKTMPSAYTVGRYTFLVGEGGAMLLDPKQDRAAWLNPAATHTDLPILLGDRVLVGDFHWTVLDLATGKQQATVHPDAGLYTVAIGDHVAGIGPDKISDLQLG
ncbi:PQQ-binding-like beta-propeller repeat protein [Microlunatus elymi]|uniref:PQQ-binding-like beta-propeller repeat protein n=1 Tax=Microlunatus elymi TaxID=2596828 RepID=A0A516PWW3_9ACTN|nr:PQQ-binding-like beta-propeller repeat protein [Microlunatus elymi]QDP95673.1 PQQ-binding-like beta-propeller repeat protein [Microlunatus elymi]